MSQDNANHWDEIDDFLDGQQDPTSRKKFKNRLAEDTQLATDLNLQQQLRSGIAYGSRDDLKARLQQIHRETQSSGRVVSMRSRSNWKNWLSVAAVLVATVLGVVLWTQGGSAGSIDLFAQHYSPYALDLTQRGEALPTDLATLNDKYEQGDFVAATPLLQKALQKDPKNATLSLALAMSQWENGEQEAAQQALQTLFTHPLLSDQAYWYAGLFALQQGDQAQAKSYMQKIKTDSGKLYQQAQALLRKL